MKLRLIEFRISHLECEHICTAAGTSTFGHLCSSPLEGEPPHAKAVYAVVAPIFEVCAHCVQDCMIFQQLYVGQQLVQLSGRNCR